MMPCTKSETMLNTKITIKAHLEGIKNQNKGSCEFNDKKDVF